MKKIFNKRLSLGIVVLMGSLWAPQSMGEQLDYWGNPIVTQNPATAAKTAQECATLYTRGSGGTLVNRTASEFSVAFNQFATCLNQVMLNDFKRMEADYQKLLQAGYKPALPY